MNPTVKSQLTILLCYIGSLSVSILLGITTIPTICNMAWTPEEQGGPAMVISWAITWALVPAFAFHGIHGQRKRDKAAFLLFSEKIEKFGYSLKSDFNDLRHDINFWLEIFFVTSLTFIFWVVYDIMYFWLLLNIPLFLIFDFASYLKVHRDWYDICYPEEE